MFRIIPEDLISALEVAEKVNGSEKEKNSIS